MGMITGKYPIIQYYQTQNDCYKKGRTIQVKGIQVHSSGANNPNLRRYVGPDDGRLGHNPNNNHWNKPGLDKCANAWIGKLSDGSVATYQCLPWDMRCWLSGSGPKGNGNDSMVGFEIAEDGLTNKDYFNEVYQAAVELCTLICQMFGLDPLGDGVILGHYEMHKRGIASNHADPEHWFVKFGKSMDTLRADVKGLLSSGTVNPVTPPQVLPSVPERPLYQATVINVKSGLNLRISPNLVAGNTIILMPLGAMVDVYADNVGNGFALVQYGSLLGYCTRSYLLQTPGEAQVLYNVRADGVSRQVVEWIRAVYPGVIVTEVREGR